MRFTNCIFQSRNNKNLDLNHHLIVWEKNTLHIQKKYQRLFLTTPGLLTLQNFHLNEEVNKEISNYFGEDFIKLDLELFNVHCAKTLKISLKNTLKTIIPTIHKQFGIERCEVSQEQHHSAPIALEELINSSANNILTVQIILNFASAKFQRSRSGEHTSIGIIFTKFDTDFQDFFYFLSEMALLLSNSKTFVKDFTKILIENQQQLKVTLENAAKLLKDFSRSLAKYSLTLTKQKEIRALNDQGAKGLGTFLSLFFKNCSIHIEAVENSVPCNNALKFESVGDSDTHLVKINSGQITFEEITDNSFSLEDEDLVNLLTAKPLSNEEVQSVHLQLSNLCYEKVVNF